MYRSLYIVEYLQYTINNRQYIIYTTYCIVYSNECWCSLFSEVFNKRYTIQYLVIHYLTIYSTSSIIYDKSFTICFITHIYSNAMYSVVCKLYYVWVRTRIWCYTLYINTVCIIYCGNIHRLIYIILFYITYSVSGIL